MPDIYINKPKQKQTEEAPTPPEKPAKTKPLKQTTEHKKVTKQDPEKALTQTQEDLNKKKNGQLKGSSNALAAIAYMPERVAFEIQEESEQVILLVRQHPIVNLGWILFSALLFITPSFVFNIPIFDFFPTAYIFAMTLVWYFITFAYALEGFLNWFFNVNIVTDERIIDIDFYNILYKEVSTTKIDAIQDVTFTRSGAIQAIFDYGDVFVQTAGEKLRFEFLKVPNPDRIVNVINDMKVEEEQEKLEGRVR